jgi:abortive infection bacteriophage resistance protein
VGFLLAGTSMKYIKPHLTFEDQARRLISRGLVADEDILVSRLETVSYYRLSAYLYPYRNSGEDTFLPGTTLDTVWYHYTFDRQLRLHMMDAIERVEVAMRTQLVYHFSQTFGAFGYRDIRNLPAINQGHYHSWVEDLRKEVGRSRETFIDHFQHKYGDEHDMPPIWMLAEIMSFGHMVTFFNGASDSIRQQIADQYGIPREVLSSWLLSINYVRNICAHHGRLWNRELGIKPAIPRINKHPQWHSPCRTPNERIFSILTILRFLLERIAPSSQWSHRLETLFALYPDIPKSHMGFPKSWEYHAIWSTAVPSIK